ncbi:MAG: helix-turn-helix domain-containing protein [Lachnoclostridium sp.]|nr:helix-turn-helix domain-containing protein [Lachnospira sp.]MCM1247339.1 helix-turn-helix domain-containing protein [Lachnoclostridium sp.]MCM1466102.1 helix-turn-helix domain-containing protein [Bacteroidales bacterium]MCM1534358.1 helix-turn-helix domain-containing protein [Clostridium sp.]MCM1327514.1 helix-turn-helix domain-containing protein [Lachnoclostridium sp.]
MVSDMTIGEILAELRTERDIYQKELALYLNVSIATISNYEKGIHYPDLETLGKLADFFGVTTDYLLNRTKYRYTPTDLNRCLTKNYTAANLLNTTLELSPKDRRLLVDYAELLKLRQQVNAMKQTQNSEKEHIT